MPEDLVLLRHGQSEANIVQKQFKMNPAAKAPAGFNDRHDSRMRLSKLGCEQAVVTGEMLNNEFSSGFDKYYVSSLTRTIETAGCLAINGTWSVDDRWRERDWGEYNYLNDDERETQMAISKKIREQSKWYWCPPGGESLATGVRLRFEDILDTLHREHNGDKVIAVTHGETMGVARFVLERLTPEEWMEQEEDSRYDVPNMFMLHYSRRNPNNGELEDKMNWRRGICAWDDDRSWDNGKWIKIEHKKYTDQELLRLADEHANLIEAAREDF